MLINGDFVILSGYLETNKAFWAKYSLNGIPISTKVFSTSSVFNDVIQDNSGNFYFSGRVNPPGSDIDVIEHGNVDVLVIKTDAELNEIWQKSFFSPATCKPVGVAALMTDGSGTRTGPLRRGGRERECGHGHRRG